MLIDARHSSPENADIAFDRICVRAAAYILANPVLYREVVFELTSDGTVIGCLVGH